MSKQPCIYILASDRNGTLYVGVTCDLVKRVWEHKNNVVPGFTKRYGVHDLVWYELHDSKEWKRQWKLELIELQNPERICILNCYIWIPAFAGMTRQKNENPFMER